MQLTQYLHMNTAKIIKLEIGEYGFCSVNLQWNDKSMSVGDFDLSQLGEVQSSGDDSAGRGWVTFTNEDPLKIGDSITDEEGGEPVIAADGKAGEKMEDTRDQRAVQANREWKGDKYGMKF